MKKFITTAARQIVTNTDGCYEAVNNPELAYDMPNSYPVFSLLNAFLKEGDDAEVIVVCLDAVENGVTNENYINIRNGAAQIAEEKGASVNATGFPVPNDEQIDTHLDIFERIITRIQPGDQVYFDVTYGTKTQMLALVIAINYVYQAVPGASVDCVVYGNYNFQTKEKKLYDISSLFVLNQIVNKLAETRHPAPVQIVRSLIHADDELLDDEDDV